MKRRNFNRFAMAAALAGPGLVANSHVIGAGDKSEFDRFGGWTDKKFNPTGFFRVEKDGRWWLVTPEGHGFLSFGINHLYRDLFRQPHNRSAWQAQLGVDDLRDESKFAPALRSWFLKTCRDFGFNTVGVHNDLRVVNRPSAEVPYLQPIKFVDIPHWKVDIPDESFLDVFSNEFAVHCNRLASKVAAPLREDPFLIGYTMTDCPLLSEEDCRERPDVIGGARRGSRIGWPRKLRNLGSDAPGKQSYVRTMQKVYRDRIADFNATYGTSFASFDALAAAENWRPTTALSNAEETRDNVKFLQAVVARYYESARDAIRRHDPNHLFLGDKLNANTDSLNTVLPITSRFTDIVFYQMYARYEVQRPGLDRWAKLASKPVINGDSAFTMITEHMPRPYGPVADTVEQRAEWTTEFFHNAFRRPEFVGWHYCGLIDASNRILRKKDRQHSGLIDEYGKPHLQLQAALKTCSSQLYEIATRR
ncbi:MAG: hypothetical protein ACR2RV_05580 [Verrucomicrobiales bacterium]